MLHFSASHGTLQHLLQYIGWTGGDTIMVILWGVLILVGVALVVWGSELFAEHLAAAAVRLGISSFALALLLAGAEPEELATAITASVQNVPAIAFGDVVGTNIAMCLVALGVGALV